jgi:hypothetical protein
MLHTEKGRSGGANSPPILLWRPKYFFAGDFLRQPAFEICLSECRTFTCSLVPERKWRNPPPHLPTTKRVKICIMCKSLQLTSLLKSLFYRRLTPSLWVFRPNSTTGRNTSPASIGGLNNSKVPKKRSRSLWSPKYCMEVPHLPSPWIGISFHRKPLYASQIFTL